MGKPFYNKTHRKLADRIERMKKTIYERELRNKRDFDKVKLLEAEMDIYK